MQSESIILDILGERKRKLFKISELAFLLSMILFFTFLIFLDNKFFTFSSLFLVLSSGILRAVLKERNIVGQLTLSFHDITVEIKGAEKSYPIKNIQSIQLKYSSYAGEPPSFPTKSILVSKGQNNYVIFHRDGNKHSYRVRIKENQIIPINSLVNSWKANGIDVLIENDWGQKIREINS